MIIAVMAIAPAMLIQNVEAQTAVPSGFEAQTNILEDCGAEENQALPAFRGADPNGLVPGEVSNQETVRFTNNGNVDVASFEVEAPNNFGGPANSPANVMDAGRLHADTSVGTNYATKSPIPLVSAASPLDFGIIAASGLFIDTFWILQAILSLAGYS